MGCHKRTRTQRLPEIALDTKRFTSGKAWPGTITWPDYAVLDAGRAGKYSKRRVDAVRAGSRLPGTICRRERAALLRRDLLRLCVHQRIGQGAQGQSEGVGNLGCRPS